MMLRLVTGANSNSAPVDTTNLLVPWQRKVIFELCCRAPEDCINASNRTTHINLIDDRPSLLCQMLSSSVDITASETSSAKSASGHKLPAQTVSTLVGSSPRNRHFGSPSEGQLLAHKATCGECWGM
jgi:hypothetical protein